MTAAGGSEADANLRTSVGTGLRLLVGWFCVMIGLLNLLAEVDRRTGEPDLPFLIFHGMLVVGGIVLLALGWLAADPGPAGYVAGCAVAMIGMVGSAVPVINSVCCMAAFAVRHGYPFSFLARTEGDAARWHADFRRLVADLLFWGLTGLLVLVTVALSRRITARPAGTPPVAATDTAARAGNPRADPPSPAGGTVGGLP